MPTTDTTVQELVINVGTTAQIEAAIAGGTITQDMLSITTDGGVVFNLFDFKWTDYNLNDLSWVKADTFSWLDGTVYTNAYNHLVADTSGITAQTETVGSYTITYYQAIDGHKIVLANMEQTVSNIYAESGVAWYYVLDTTNQRFKLPRCSHGAVVEKHTSGTEWYKVYSDGWCEQGDTVSITTAGQTINLLKAYTNTNYTITSSGGTNKFGNTACYDKDTNSFKAWTSDDETFNAGDLSWVACGYISSPVANTPYKNLYMYVGQYSYSAVEQTAGLNASLFNGKADIDLGNISQTGLTRINNWIANKFYSSGVQNLTKYEDIASSTTTYTAPIDGFIRVKIGATYSWQLYINGEIFQEQSRNDSDSCVTTWVVIPVLRGDVLTRSGSTYHFDGGAMWYFS